MSKFKMLVKTFVEVFGVDEFNAAQGALDLFKNDALTEKP